MKYYILQENYTEFDPEGHWDGEDYETTEYECLQSHLCCAGR